MFLDQVRHDRYMQPNASRSVVVNVEAALPPCGRYAVGNLRSVSGHGGVKREPTCARETIYVITDIPLVATSEYRAGGRVFPAQRA